MSGLTRRFLIGFTPKFMQSLFFVFPQPSTTYFNGYDGVFVKYDGSICHQSEPKNFIYPYFSNRKPFKYQTMIQSHNANVVEESFENLPSKIDRIANPDFPDHEAFREYCQSILGIKISSAQHENGKQAAKFFFQFPVRCWTNKLSPIEDLGLAFALRRWRH